MILCSRNQPFAPQFYRLLRVNSRRWQLVVSSDSLGFLKSTSLPLTNLLTDIHRTTAEDSSHQRHLRILTSANHSKSHDPGAMAPSLTTLPCEIVHEILCHCSADNLARARLVSSHFREPASRLLFRKLTLWHTPQSAARAGSIIASKHLRACVRELCFSGRASNHTIDVRSLDLLFFKDP